MVQHDKRIFPIGYAVTRLIDKKAGKRAGVEFNPYDLRRHFASRPGTPIEIDLKIILRHANFKTSQRYLEKMSETETMRGIEALHGRESYAEGGSTGSVLRQRV